MINKHGKLAFNWPNCSLVLLQEWGKCQLQHLKIHKKPMLHKELITWVEIKI